MPGILGVYNLTRRFPTSRKKIVEVQFIYGNRGMQTLFLVIAASIIGGLVLIYLLPVLTRLTATFISTSKLFSPGQKARLLTSLRLQSTDNTQGDWALLYLYAISLVAEIFFLYINSVGSARAILVGMFLMLFVRSFTRAFQVKQTPSRR